MLITDPLVEVVHVDEAFFLSSFCLAVDCRILLPLVTHF